MASSPIPADIADLVESSLLAALARTASGADPLLRRAMGYGLMGGGKRLRPALVIMVGDLFEVPRDQSATVGAAVEFVHAYSLIHDDLPAMDDSPLRRGQPSAHKAFDEATAILAGDALLTDAFALLTVGQKGIAPDIQVRLVAELAAAAGSGGMVSGQMLDMLAETQPDAQVDIAEVQRKKTGAMIRFCARAGGLLGRADEAQMAALTRYAEALGLAFQITDDILDATSDAATLGKPGGQDAVREKATFVSTLGLDGARTRAQALVDESVAALGTVPGDPGALEKVAQFVLDRQR